MNDIHSKARIFLAWCVHVFTASGAAIGLYAIWAIDQQDYSLALWLMALTIFIDAIDGTLARAANVKMYAPKINGELLDNVVDFFTFVAVPAYILIDSPLLDEEFRLWIAGMILVASAYQFSQINAKTIDHFFTGFPSYWNIVICYLFFLNLSQFENLLVISVLLIAVFIPIKYLYPSRLEHFTNNRWFQHSVLFATILWGILMVILLWTYPEINKIVLWLSLVYVVFYFVLSIWHTLRS